MRKYFIGAIALLSVFVSCTKNEQLQSNQEQAQEGKKIHIEFTNVSSAKTSIDDGGTDVTFKWVVGDKIYVYDDTKLCGTLTLDSKDKDKEEGSFAGDINEPEGSKLKFIHFGSKLTAPQSSNMTLDVYNQDGTLKWSQEHIITTCVLPNAGSGSYSGEMKAAFAIGRFSFQSTDFTGQKIRVRGLKRTVTVAQNGDISYGNPGKDRDIAVIDFATTRYVAMPSGEAADKVAFVNTSTKKYKYFDTAIENGVFYRAADGGDIPVIIVKNEYVVRYWADQSIIKNFERFPKSTSEYTGSDLTHTIINEEPYWQGEDVVYTFLGWSEDQNDTVGRYKSSLKSEDEGVLNTLGIPESSSGKVEINLYAIWKKVEIDGPWVDFEHYTLSGNSFRFSYIYGCEVNDSIRFKTGVQGAHYEHINFPVRNLEEDTWYKLEFSEEMRNKDQSVLTTGAWNGDRGIYANTVRSTTLDGSSYTSCNYMVTYNNNPDSFVWVHSEGQFGDSPYYKTPYDVIFFKASAKTMYWIWDLSKQRDGEEFLLAIKTIKSKVSKLEEVYGTTPAVDFISSTIHGFRTTASSNPAASVGGGHIAGSGFGSYKSSAKYNEYVEIHSTGYSDSGDIKNEKINIPIKNLTSGSRYRITFTYNIPFCEQADPYQTGDGDMCYGFFASPNENTDKNTKYHDTEGYSQNINGEALPYTKTEEFIATANTMYMVWSVGLLKEDYRITQRISVSNLEEVN